VSTLSKSSVKVEKNSFRKLSNAIRSRQHATTKHLVGRVLTVVEASARDEIQREALKSLVREVVYNSIPHSYTEMINQFTTRFEGEKIKPLGEPTVGTECIDYFPKER